jgi:hypothetical protein
MVLDRKLRLPRRKAKMPRRMPMWMKSALIFQPQWRIFFYKLKKYQHKELLEDLGVPGLTVK